ncbi:diguanylate cyclase domain-containing protein [Mesorhizobium sp. ANAO-SY3R2]|uniref:sensor domain-containing diguanylate cyclase n=1 Tax=Mesorhizobium sp. ANAO-SY3R2 TaxID=3166644 RepID=UPI00366C59E0
MGENHKGGSAWRFAIRVVLPVVLAVGITIAAVAGFVYLSTAKSDDRALQRETHLVARVIGQQMKALRGQQAYYSSWDEAIEALFTNDIGWIDANLASDLYSNAKFDRIYVLDPAAQPIYAMYAGGKTNSERFEADRAVIAPMVERLKAINAAGALAAFDSGNSTEVPAVAEIGMIDGRPAYVGVTAIMSESRDAGMEQVPGMESFLVGVRFLAGAMGAELAEQYFMTSPNFAATASTEPGIASYALKNEAGQTVGWFTWRPDRPGAMILSETLPAMLGALAIAVIVLVLLLRSLRRTTAALENGKARAEHLANHDTLTGLANRAFFNRRLEEAINGGLQGGEESVALLALDLDRFKQVNDSLGHEAGDQLLREVAQRLASLVEAGDTVARLGGDEFAIIRRHVRAADDISTLSDRIIAELGAPFVLAGRVAQIGVSIGVVITPANRAPRDLTTKADIALYEAKAAGRNTFRIFDEATHKAAQFRGQIDEEMRVSNLPVKRDRVA